jgi:hypothetical protein
MRWNVWCDVHDKAGEQQQIHNNIRSLALAQAAGYQAPGWNNVDCVAWLDAWKKAVGKDEIRSILQQQDLADQQKFADLLK